MRRPTDGVRGVPGAHRLTWRRGELAPGTARHLVRAQLGPAAGITALPELRTLRPRLAALAEATDPLGLQRRLAAAMLGADAPGLGLYFVDDHCVPYAGAKPVPKDRAITRNLPHRGGTITYTTATITVALDRSATPRLTRAATLLLDEINTSPPRLPGDARPITYRLTQT